MTTTLALRDNLEVVEHRLRTEKRLMLLPPGLSTLTVVVDTYLHEQMMASLAVGGADMLLVGIGGGVLASLLATGGMLLAAARTGTFSALPPLKRLMWSAVGAGGALALFGGHPLIVGGYYLTALIGTWPWYRDRVQAVRELRAQIAAAPSRDALAGDGQVSGEGFDDVMEAEVVDDTPPDLADYERRWIEGVAPSHLPDTHLKPGQVHADGRISFVVQSGPKGISLAAANAARDKIAAALRLKLPGPDGTGGQDIVFDQPTTGELADRSQLRVQIVNQRSAAARGTRFQHEISSAPDNPYQVRIGGFIDDGTDARWTFADDTGAHSGFLLAGSRMGKSSLTDGLAYRARQLGYLIGYLDPQRGASSPVLAEFADFPVVGAENAFAFLQWLEAEADLRESWAGAHHLGKITPWTIAECLPHGRFPNSACPCGGVVPPGLFAYIDECDQVFEQLEPNSTTTRLGIRFGRLAKRINKLNMGIIAASQVPEQRIFGGSELLRSILSLTNFLAMRVNAGSSGNLIPGLPYSPSLLPKIAGRALMCGAASRQMEQQLDFMPRREDNKHHAGPYAEDMFAALPRARSWAPDVAIARRFLPQPGVDPARQSQQAALHRLASLMGVATTPVAAPTGAPSGSSPMAWPAAVKTPSAAELEAMLTPEVVAAVLGLPDDQWLTAGDLARRMGRVAEGADDGELRARARDVAAELAAKGIELEKKAPGMSTTVRQIRMAWS